MHCHHHVGAEALPRQMRPSPAVILITAGQDKDYSNVDIERPPGWSTPFWEEKKLPSTILVNKWYENSPLLHPVPVRPSAIVSDISIRAFGNNQRSDL